MISEGTIPYPIRLEADFEPRQGRLVTLLRVILIIPLYLATVVLGIVAYIVVPVSWIAVTVLGRWPDPLWRYVSGWLRFTVRFGAYLLLLTDRYPPFTLEDEPAYPVRVTFERPERIARWRPLLNWLLAVPMLIVLYALLIVAYLAAFVAWFAILVTGRLPQPLFEAGRVALSWQTRVIGFVLWMTGRYPPFELS